MSAVLRTGVVMPKFLYTVKDKEAKLFKGSIEALDKQSAIKELKKRNFFLISIAEERARSAVFGQFSANITSMDLVVFCRQLATLIDAGISLVAGLNILHEQVSHAQFKKIILCVKNDIEAGNSLHASFAKYPHVFPTIFINMIRAGEISGSLNEILDRAAMYFERMENLKRKIKSALMYPALVISMAFLILLFLMLKVVPTFKGIFLSLGGELPLPTKILLAVSDMSVKFVPFLILFFIVFSIMFQKYIHTEKGSIRLDEVKLKLPLFGEIVSKMAISKFSRTLATLVRSGVPILQSFEIAGKASGNKVIELATEQIRGNMRAGENISEPMEKTGKFPPFVVRMIAVGEQTAELEKMLSKISEYYDNEVDESLSGLTSMIEPLVICFLGITIGFIVSSLFLPIFKLTELVGK